MVTFYDAPDIFIKAQKFDDSGTMIEEIDLSPYVDANSLDLDVVYNEAQLPFGLTITSKFEFTLNTRFELNGYEIFVYNSNGIAYFRSDVYNIESDFLNLSNRYIYFDKSNKLFDIIIYDTDMKKLTEYGSSLFNTVLKPLLYEYNINYIIRDISGERKTDTMGSLGFDCIIPKILDYSYFKEGISLFKLINDIAVLCNCICFFDGDGILTFLADRGINTNRNNVDTSGNNYFVNDLINYHVNLQLNEINLLGSRKIEYLTDAVIESMEYRNLNDEVYKYAIFYKPSGDYADQNIFQRFDSLIYINSEYTFSYNIDNCFLNVLQEKETPTQQHPSRAYFRFPIITIQQFFNRINFSGSIELIREPITSFKKGEPDLYGVLNRLIFFDYDNKQYFGLCLGFNLRGSKLTEQTLYCNFNKLQIKKSNMYIKDDTLYSEVSESLIYKILGIHRFRYSKVYRYSILRNFFRENEKKEIVTNSTINDWSYNNIITISGLNAGTELEIITYNWGVDGVSYFFTTELPVTITWNLGSSNGRSTKQYFEDIVNIWIREIFLPSIDFFSYAKYIIATTLFQANDLISFYTQVNRTNEVFVSKNYTSMMILTTDNVVKDITEDSYTANIVVRITI